MRRGFGMGIWHSLPTKGAGDLMLPIRALA